MNPTLHIHRLELESELLGFPVEKIAGWVSTNEIFAYVNDLYKQGGRVYLYLEVDAADIEQIHNLQRAGFLLSEFRVHAQLDLDGFDNYSKAFYPYVADLITEEKHLSTACEILAEYPTDDRFSREPDQVLPKEFSKKRNDFNLKKSFLNYPKEWIIGMFNSNNAMLEGFCSLGFHSEDTAFIYQQAVRISQLSKNNEEILEPLMFSFLKENGIRWVKSITTGFNISEINRRIHNSGFQALNTTVVLRQIINSA